MNFKISLDEALFDDEFDSEVVENPAVSSIAFDDDFSEYIDEHTTEDVLPGPAAGADTGVAAELIALINDEWEAIEGYNNAIASLRANISANPFYEDAIKVLEEISAEENVHVGQLQEVLKRISPNAADIDKGAAEARSQLGMVGGVLPVQTWDSVKNNSTESTDVNKIEDVCTLCDVDDEM